MPRRSMLEIVKEKYRGKYVKFDNGGEPVYFKVHYIEKNQAFKPSYSKNRFWFRPKRSIEEGVSGYGISCCKIISEAEYMLYKL